MPSVVADPWRRRCPEGHTTVIHRSGKRGDVPAHYDCESCETEYEYVVDVKTGRRIEA